MAAGGRVPSEFLRLVYQWRVAAAVALSDGLASVGLIFLVRNRLIQSWCLHDKGGYYELMQAHFIVLLRKQQ